MGLVKQYFEAELASALGRKRSKSTGPSSSDLRKLGFSAGSALERVTDHLARHQAMELGELHPFPTKRWIPTSRNALSFLLEEPYLVDAALSHCVPLGTTGSGDVWLVSLEARAGRNEVCLYHHDTGTVAKVADSLSALLFANHLIDRDDGGTPAERKALAGHVFWSQDFELPWKTRPKPGPSLTRDLLTRTRDLRSVLNGYTTKLPAAARPLKARPLPAEILDALLRAYLRGETTVAQRLFARFRDAPGKLVRDSVAVLEALSAEGSSASFSVRLSHLLRKRHPTRKAAAMAQEDNGDDLDYLKLTAQETQERGRHADAERLYRKALIRYPKDAQLWASLCYSLYCLERWKDMAAAADRAIKLTPKSSYAHQQLAIAQLRLEDWTAAVRPARRALALDPKNAYAMYSLGTALVMQGKREGVHHLERAGQLASELRRLLKADADLKRALAKLG